MSGIESFGRHCGCQKNPKIRRVLVALPALSKTISTRLAFPAKMYSITGAVSSAMMCCFIASRPVADEVWNLCISACVTFWRRDRSVFWRMRWD